MVKTVAPISQNTWREWHKNQGLEKILAEEQAMNVVAWALYVGIAAGSPVLIKDDFKDKAACGASAELILRSSEYHFIGQSGNYGKSASYGLAAFCMPVMK